MIEAATIVGYGSQGQAHALNLRDAGWDVRVLLRQGSPRAETARADEVVVTDNAADALRGTTFVTLLIPDTAQAEAWRDWIAPAVPAGTCLVFASGMNIHFRQIVPSPALDVVLAAPLCPGTTLRRNFLAGLPTPIATAVHQDATGSAGARLNTYVTAVVKATDQVVPTTFREETEVDLFSEQALSCGGLSRLILAATEVMTAAGYNAAMIRHSVLDEVRELAALFAEHGVTDGLERISATARYGAITRGPRVINASVRAAMHEIMLEIRDGRFVKELIEGMTSDQRPATSDKDFQ